MDQNQSGDCQTHPIYKDIVTNKKQGVNRVASGNML
jgi:hypothetical protein